MAILDADKEGFLRNDVSLIQTAGRAARHVNGRVIMYADRITDSMRRAMDETSRRRSIQTEYNRKHGITPASIQKEIREGIEKYQAAEELVAEVAGEDQKAYEAKTYLAFLKSRMEAAARALDFPKAARYRDEIRRFEIKEAEGAQPSEKAETTMLPKPLQGDGPRRRQEKKRKKNRPYPA